MSQRFYLLIKVHQNHFSNIKNLKNKMNIVKIKTNAHDLPNETSYSTNPKTPWDESIYKICNIKEIHHNNRA